MTLSLEKKKIIVIAYAAVSMDMLNFAIIVPILPYLSMELNATTMEEGILFSSYAIFQLISTICSTCSCIGLLIMGPLSDRYGRKPFLLLTLLGPCVGNLLIPLLIHRFHPAGFVVFYAHADLLEILYGSFRWRHDSGASVPILFSFHV